MRTFITLLCIFVLLISPRLSANEPDPEDEWPDSGICFDAFYSPYSCGGSDFSSYRLPRFDVGFVFAAFQEAMATIAQTQTQVQNQIMEQRFMRFDDIVNDGDFTIDYPQSLEFDYDEEDRRTFREEGPFTISFTCPTCYVYRVLDRSGGPAMYTAYGADSEIVVDEDEGEHELEIEQCYFAQGPLSSRKGHFRSSMFAVDLIGIYQYARTM